MKTYQVTESKILAVTKTIVNWAKASNDPNSPTLADDILNHIREEFDIPQPTKKLSEMTEADAKKFCEAMGWEFDGIDKRNRMVSIYYIGENGGRSYINFTFDNDVSSFRIINPFTLVSCLRDLGYGVNNKDE